MPAYKDEKRGTWYASFYYTDWQGIRHKKKKRGFTLKREAETYEREFLLKNAGDPDMSFATLVELFYADLEKRVRKTTLQNKKNIIDKHILPHFKNRKISEITNTDIRAWQNTMLSKKMTYKNKDSKPYAATYLRSVNSQLSSIFSFAVEFYKLPSNPCSTVKAIGKKQAPEMDFWTLEEFNTLIKYEQKPAFHLLFMLLYWGGFRIGECLALTPKKIIHEIKALDIGNSYRREDGKDIIGETKTDNSIRKTVLPDFVYDELIEYINRLYKIEDDERIFYFTRSTTNRELKRIATAAGVKPLKEHCLRHSHVALLIELGYGVHAIAARIGNTPEEVNRTYAHLYPNKDQLIAQDLNKYKDGMITKDTNIVKDNEYDEKKLIETIENMNNKNTN